MDKLAPTEIRYPYEIVRACTDLPYHPKFAQMPDGFLKVVIKIVQKINLRKPFTEIFASRQTLADEAGKSLDTVHRAIQWLEQNKLIERERQARAGLRGSRSPLIPTRDLLAALGLIDEKGKARMNRAAGPAALCIDPSSADRVETAGSPEVGCDTGHDSRAAGAYTRIGPVSVPSDLIWLCRLGLTPFAVLGLMKKARQASQRLSHVVAAAKKYLGNLRANQLYAYLCALIASGRDFSAISLDEEKKSLEIREKSYLSEKSEIFEGRKFVSKKTGKVYLVESGVIREMCNGQTRVTPFTRAFLDALEAGKVVACA